MENSALARLVKSGGKKSIVELNFIKVVGQKSDAVINMELFLNVFWNYWKGWRLEVKGNSKIKVYGHTFVRLCLKSPDESVWKIKHKVPYRGKVTNFSWNFCHFFLSRKKIFPMKNFTCRTHFSKWKLKLKSRQPFRNDIPIVNMVED